VTRKKAAPKKILPKKEAPAQDNPVADLKASHARLVVELALGATQEVAAEAAGLTYDYVRQLLLRRPDLLDAVEAARARITGHDLHEWAEYHAVMRQKLVALTSCGDKKVEFMAVRDFLDRMEGKPRQQIDLKVEADEDNIGTPEMRLAVALVFAGRFPTLVQAIEHIQKNPDLLRTWAQQHPETAS
jgi:hypothetical protein